VKGLTGAGFAKRVGKILKAKMLEVKILKAKELRCFLGAFHGPPALDHHLLISCGGSRSDVTRGCGSLMRFKTFRNEICLGHEKPKPHSLYNPKPNGNHSSGWD
jgi:hypothetical protein